MKIPCKDCLILPICKNKRYIKCSILHTWCIRLPGGVKWDVVRERLPNVVSVIHDRPCTIKYTLHNWDLMQKEMMDKGVEQYIKEER